MRNTLPTWLENMLRNLKDQCDSSASSVREYLECIALSTSDEDCEGNLQGFLAGCLDELKDQAEYAARQIRDKFRIPQPAERKEIMLMDFNGKVRTRIPLRMTIENGQIYIYGPPVHENDDGLVAVLEQSGKELMLCVYDPDREDPAFIKKYKVPNVRSLRPQSKDGTAKKENLGRVVFAGYVVDLDNSEMVKHAKDAVVDDIFGSVKRDEVDSFLKVLPDDRLKREDIPSFLIEDHEGSGEDQKTPA